MSKALLLELGKEEKLLLISRVIPEVVYDLHYSKSIKPWHK